MDFLISKLNKPKVYNKTPALQNYNFGTIEPKETSAYNTNSYIPDYLKLNTLCINFNNLGEVFSLTRELGKPTGKYNSSQDNVREGKWTKFSDYDTAYETLKNKPQEVVSFNASEVAINDIQESGNDVFYDVVGDYLDVGRYLDGVPEAFGNMYMGNYRGVRVKIFCDVSAPASVSSDIIDHRSKRLCRLVDWLETQGIRVSLNCIYSSDNGHFDIKVKDYSEPLNIYDVGVSSNVDFFRRLVFRLIETSKTISYGYGSAYAFSYFQRRLANFCKPKDLQELLLFIDNQNLQNTDSVDEQFDKIERYITALLPTGDYKIQMFDDQITDELINKLKGVAM